MLNKEWFQKKQNRFFVKNFFQNFIYRIAFTKTTTFISIEDKKKESKKWKNKKTRINLIFEQRIISKSILCQKLFPEFYIYRIAFAKKTTFILREDKIKKIRNEKNKKTRMNLIVKQRMISKETKSILC